MLMSTAILFLVILAVVWLIYGIASLTIMTQTRILMEEILDNDGELPEEWDYESEKKPYLALYQESIYEIRYYTAMIVEDNTQISDMNIRLKEKDAKHIARTAYMRRKDYGRITIPGGRIMNYMKKTNEDGSTLLVILDSTSRYSLIHIVSMYLFGLLFSVLVMYVIIMGNYSKKLVKPFIESDEKQKRFITNASHELKTPLSVISLNTEMMETTGGRTKWTESTLRQVDRLKNLIEDLVVLSRLDEMQEVALTKTDLSTIVTETAEGFRGVIEDSGKTLILDIGQDISVTTEKRSIQQLVSILMDNAAKYCDENGEIQVNLSSYNKNKGARLTVSNTYAEGADVDYTRFFERFYRGDASHNSSSPGFGIGLSMGKEIADRLGGKLKVGYSEGVISFYLELP